MSKRKQNIDYPKYVNHEYFNKINTEKKAYFLGLLIADGNISENKGNRQKTLTISLQEPDSYILKELCKEITPTKNIRIINSPSIIKNNWQKRAVFKVSSDKLCNNLIKYGCIPNKSKLGVPFNFSLINEEFWSHFIRGFFDGDGCIYVKTIKNRYVRKTTQVIKNPFKEKLSKVISFCSTSEQFLKNILIVLKNSCNLTSKPQWNNKLRTQMVYVLKIEGQKDIKPVQEFLYKNATIFMKRKFDKFNKTISSQAVDIFTEGSETINNN